MTDIDAHGPIDYVVLEFPGDGIGDATVQAISDLIDQGTIRLYDLLVVRMGTDGVAEAIDLEASGSHALGALAGARSGLLGSDDVADVAGVLEPGHTALVVLFENAWAAPFVAAARGEGGEMIATARLTAQQIMDALEAADAAG